jgi:tight adherence protein B
MVSWGSLMSLSPQWVLTLACIFALASLVFGFRANRSQIRRVREREAWPAFVESVISSIAAGSSRVEAFELAVARAPSNLQMGLRPFEDALKRRRLADALQELRASFENAQVDEFVQILTLNEKFGGAGLVGVLKTYAKACRAWNAAEAQVRSKNAASLTVAKLGVAAPWILLTLLLGRPESATSFENSAGIAILLGGLVVCVCAFSLIVLLGRQREEVRVYATKA